MLSNYRDIVFDATTTHVSRFFCFVLMLSDMQETCGHLERDPSRLGDCFCALLLGKSFVISDCNKCKCAE